MAYTKVTIEMEDKNPIILEFEDFNLDMKQHIKAHGNKEYTLGDRYAVMNGWLVGRKDAYERKSMPDKKLQRDSND